MSNLKQAISVPDSCPKAINRRSRRKKQASQFCVNSISRPNKEVIQKNTNEQAQKVLIAQKFKCFKCFGSDLQANCRECRGNAYVSASHPLVEQMERILVWHKQRDYGVVKNVKKEYLLLPNTGTDVINQQSFSVQDQHSILSKDLDRESSEGCELETKAVWLQSPDLGRDQLRRLSGRQLEGSVKHSTDCRKAPTPYFSLSKDTGPEHRWRQQELIHNSREVEGSDNSGLDSSFVNICKDWSQSYEAPTISQKIEGNSFNSLKSSQSRAYKYDLPSNARDRTFFEQGSVEGSKLAQNNFPVDCVKREGRVGLQRQPIIRDIDLKDYKQIQEAEGISSLSYGEGEETISIKILPRKEKK